MAALAALEARARAGEALAVMCAETRWWRCHRRLIADALVFDGFAVRHLIDEPPGMAHEISAASAVNARGGFWFQIYKGALSGELFVQLLKRMMRARKKPVHLIIDGLPAHKKALVDDYVQSTRGRLTLHFLPGYAPDLNPDELVWSHVKRTGTARRPLQAGEHLDQRIDAELAAVQRNPKLVRSFFKHPFVVYVMDG